MSVYTCGKTSARPPDAYAPEQLYHYQRLGSSEMVQRLERTLLGHEIYFSSPASFNDPFDCKVWPSFDGSLEQRHNYIERVAQLKHGGDAKAAREEIERASADPQFFQKAYSHFLEHEIPTLGVYCLSEPPDDILMWSHYASSHSGICLAFAGNYIFPECALEQINYPDNNGYPNVNFFTATKDEQINAALLTKAKHWDYEREWRVVDITGPGWHGIRPEWLIGVIFGCQTPAAQIAEIRRIVSQRQSSLQLFQAKQKYRDFSLSLQPV
jgi:Protein of unknown function (DUF2971)